MDQKAKYIAIKTTTIIVIVIIAIVIVINTDKHYEQNKGVMRKIWKASKGRPPPPTKRSDSAVYAEWGDPADEVLPSNV